MYKNYIFDLYGTLVDIKTDEDDEDLWYKLALFYSFKGAEYSSMELQKSYRRIVKDKLSDCKNTKYPDIHIEEVFIILYKNKGISPSEELITDTAHFFRILSIKYLKLYDGVINLLNELKAKNKKIYLLSNAQRIFTLYEMNTLGIKDYFDDIFFSSDFKICKPDSKFFNALINKYNLNLNETIMIGNDSISDIEGAYQCGIDSLYIHSNLSPEIKGSLNSTYSLTEMDFQKISKILL